MFSFKTDYARTVFIFGLVELSIGLSGLFLAGLNVQLAGLPEGSETVFRIVGACCVAFGYYYIRFGKLEDINFAKFSVEVRLGLSVIWLSLMLMGLLPMIFIGLFLYDLLGAAWTYMALKKTHNFL